MRTQGEMKILAPKLVHDVIPDPREQTSAACHQFLQWLFVVQLINIAAYPQADDKRGRDIVEIQLGRTSEKARQKMAPQVPKLLKMAGNFLAGFS